MRNDQMFMETFLYLQHGKTSEGNEVGRKRRKPAVMEISSGNESDDSDPPKIVSSNVCIVTVQSLLIKTKL
jgi:hypothetical protein